MAKSTIPRYGYAPSPSGYMGVKGGYNPLHLLYPLAALTMRFTLCILGLVATSFALAVEAPERITITGPQIEVQLSIANPCLSSQYADIASCRGQMTQRIVESTQQMQLHTPEGKIITDAPTTSYLVRTIDYY